jgi:hypothetical protein
MLYGNNTVIDLSLNYAAEKNAWFFEEQTLAFLNVMGEM